MLDKMDKELLEKLRATLPDEMAKELVSIQPMDSSVWPTGKSEADLIAEGYKPVCEKSRLIWVKDET